jgi:CheY-like chemotaxis protein
LLAGRKLLLADDSVTIQKVIELTFADEGVRVMAFSNGLDAIQNLEELAPDIVLADVFMPAKSGYEVCEYVKRNEKLKHIPVMLLVGSFEPFDEAEARRVGADDILTKPFQSIRRLIDRVGALVGNPPKEMEEVATAELPRSEDTGPGEEVRLNTQQLETSTADTMPLPEDLEATYDFERPGMNKTDLSEQKIETAPAEVNESMNAESSDVLLDLGEFETESAVASDDFVLDLDAPSFEDTLGGELSAPSPMRAFIEPQVSETVAIPAAPAFDYEPAVQPSPYSQTEAVAYEDQVHELLPATYEREESQQDYDTNPISETAVESQMSSAVSTGSLSQQMIDAIARRVVEMMSDKVVREIAWEVVPELAELMIKRQLEEKASQTN